MSEAKDRSGCKALEDIGQACLDWAEDTGGCHFCNPDEEGVHDEDCPVGVELLRKRRPIPAPEPAKPQRQEIRAGQTRRWNGNGKDYLLSRPEVMGTEKVWWCATRGENEGFFREPVFERGELTLIADAPAPEATGKADMFGCPYCPMTFANVEQRDAHAHPPRGPHLCANPLPAGKVEAAKAEHNFSDPYCARRHNGRTVVLCIDCGAFDQDGMRADKCVKADWRGGFEAWVGDKSGHAGGVTSVLRADTPQLIDRRRSYQPMDDSFAEDC